MTVTGAKYVDEYKIEITFSNGKTKVVDFLPALEKYGRGYYAKYIKLANFKKFKVENGNIVWGKDWDLIFTNESVYKGKF